jgi:hypothetical protein
MSFLPGAGVWKVDAGFAAGWAGAALAAYFLLVVPARESRSRAAAEHAVLTTKQQGAMDAEKSRDDLQKQLQARKASLKEFSALKLLHVSEQNRRLPELTRLAEEHRLKIMEQSSKAPTLGGGFARVPITLSGTATYTDAAGFIADLHKRFPDTQVAAFSLRAAATEQGVTGSASTCRFELVWFADPSAPGKSEGAEGKSGATGGVTGASGTSSGAAPVGVSEVAGGSQTSRPEAR